MKDILPLSADDFGLFQDLLIEKSGLCFEEGRSQSLHLALWQRLRHRGYDSYREYYNLLKFHPEGRMEIRELLDLITIGETHFFRNKAQFDVLMKFVLPEIIQRRLKTGDRCIRVWSAGCSGGDEAYSIAIATMEVLLSLEEWRISVLGTDINRNELAHAKEAIYGKKAIAHLPEGYLDKYFNVRGTGYVLNTNVKDLVQFEYHNLARDPFVHEKMQNIDILFCRNVTIYFDGQTTKRVIENFYNCLAEDGYLFLGHSETLWQITNKFERVEFPQTFIYKKLLGPFQEDAMKPFMAIPEFKLDDLTSATGTVTGQPFFLQELKSRLQERPEPLEQVEGSTLRVEKPPGMNGKVESAYQEATLCLKAIKDPAALSSPDQPTAQEKSPIHHDLAKAMILANEARYKEAADILVKIIEMDNLNVEAYYLLGVLSYKNNDLKEAETQFRKVIYVSPDSVLAYFNLGNIYLYQGKFNGAAREFRNAVRLLEQRPKNEQVRFCEDLTVEFLLRACRNNLREISKRGG
jgi:chemotaxis protein methyltransferase CheR